MANILCYGDSNTWGCIPLEGQEPARRFPPDARWPGVLRRELGEGNWIVEPFFAEWVSREQADYGVASELQARKASGE